MFAFRCVALFHSKAAMYHHLMSDALDIDHLLIRILVQHICLTHDSMVWNVLVCEVVKERQ